MHGFFGPIIPFQGKTQEKIDFIAVGKYPGDLLESFNGLLRVFHYRNQPGQMKKKARMSGPVPEMGPGDNGINSRDPQLGMGYIDHIHFEPYPGQGLDTGFYFYPDIFIRKIGQLTNSNNLWGGHDILGLFQSLIFGESRTILGPIDKIPG